MKTAAELARVALAAIPAAGRFTYDRLKSIVLRNAPQWLTRQINSSGMFARALAGTKVITGLKPNSPQVQAALSRFGPLIKSSKYYGIPTKVYTPPLMSYSWALWWKFSRFVRQHPFMAATMGYTGASICDDLSSVMDDDVARELEEDGHTTPPADAAKYDMTDAEFDEAKREFHVSLRKFFPELPLVMTDADTGKFLIALMTHDPVGGVQVFLACLAESGLINCENDSGIACLLAGTFEKFAAVPGVKDEEHAWFGDMLAAALSSVGSLDDVFNDAANRFTEILPMPDLEEVSEQVDAMDAVKEHRKRIASLARLFGGLRAAAQFGAFAMFLIEKREAGEDVFQYLKDLAEGRV